MGRRSVDIVESNIVAVWFYFDVWLFGCWLDQGSFPEAEE